MTESVVPKHWKMMALNQTVDLQASQLGEVVQAAAQAGCPGAAWAVDDFVYEVCELQGSSLHRVPYVYAADSGFWIVRCRRAVVVTHHWPPVVKAAPQI